MSVTVITFLLLGVFLVLFGLGFAFYGMSSEKAYWFQRDPKAIPLARPRRSARSTRMPSPSP